MGSTVIIKGLTAQANQCFINGRQTPIQKDGTFYEEVIVPLGQTEIAIEVKDPDGRSNRYAKTIDAKANHFFLAGIADGTLNFVDASDGFNLKRDNSRFKDGTRMDGKVSYYLTGKIQGKFLIKSSLDTDKATQKKLFTNIDPDKYYPVYGDDSTVVYDAHSQGKFYLLIEWDKSGLVLGNYQTQIGDDDSKLTTYNRTLYGAKLHLETPARTVYGDSVTKATGFIAEANQLKGHSELLGTGGSLYYMRHRNIVEGSEDIHLDVRDKNTGLTISSIPQKENVDYEIKYDEGRVLFKKPVSSVFFSDTVISDTVLEGNDVFVVANYEYTGQDAFPILGEDLDDASGGVRGSQQITDNIRVGGTYVQEEKDNKNHVMLGGDVTWKLGNFTKVNAEWAETRADSASSFISYNGGYDYTEVAVANGTKGNAIRLDFNSNIGEFFGKDKEFLDVSGYWRAIGRNFSPSDTLFESGSEKYGLEVAHQLTPSDKLRFMYEDGAIDKGIGTPNSNVINDLGAAREQNFIGQWVHDWKKFIFTTEYRAQGKKTAVTAISDVNGTDTVGHVVAEKVDYHLSDATTLFVSQQSGLSDSADNISSAGITQQITSDLLGYLRGSLGQDRNSVLAGVSRQEDAWTSNYVNIIKSDSAVDGATSATVFGSNTKISKTAELRRERQLVTSDTRGIYTSDLTALKNQFSPEWDVDATYERREEALDSSLRGSTPKDALSTTVAYVKPDHLKANTKFEYRVDTGDDWQSLSDSQAEWKASQDWFLFGEYEYSQGKDITRDISTSRIEKRQVGVAFRPVDFDWFNWLGRWTHLQDDRPRDIVSADGGFFTQKSSYNEFATEFAYDLPWVLTHFQFVNKFVYRDQDLIAVAVNNIIETPQSLKAYLAVYRLNYHLTNVMDIATEFRSLRQNGSDINTLEYGPLFELTYQIHKNIALGTGYNFTSFKDDLTVLEKKKAEGFFVRLQGKY